MTVAKKFILKDVRCFEGEQRFNIRPLTFLVGENSTGKSTVLGCMQALGNFAGAVSTSGMVTPFDFNADPYRMGAYVDIARKIGGRGGKRESFDLGFEMQLDEKETAHLLVTLIEREHGSEPALQRLKIEFNDVLMVFEIIDLYKAPQSEPQYLGFGVPNKSSTDDGKPIYTFQLDDEKYLFLIMHYSIFEKFLPKERGEANKELHRIVSNILSRLTKEDILDAHAVFSPLFPPYRGLLFESFAPIRSKPMRTYDPVREVADPEGSGTPMTLMNMYRSDKEGWEGMRKALVEFGKASGLFTDIGIKRHGGSVNDPFQLQVKVKGPKTNIIDVGYGVSQILPILVRIINTVLQTTFLVQQPEVHLHPKGQAELVTFMIDVKNKGGHSFIVETHSDAMINRARIEILKGRVKPEDVSLIYLEPVGNKVNVHNIEFDAKANMEGVPEGYRNFFLKEHDKLLGFGD